MNAEKHRGVGKQIAENIRWANEAVADRYSDPIRTEGNLLVFHADAKHIRYGEWNMDGRRVLTLPGAAIYHVGENEIGITFRETA